MRADGLWHPHLVAVLESMGHTDEIVIADAGLPIPRGVERIDLAWARNEPRFLPVLRAVCAELVVESACVTNETSDPGLVRGIAQVLDGVAIERIAHDQLKQRTASACAVVRTGEATPYANVILTAGVPF